jgi:hypothetical protein
MADSRRATIKRPAATSVKDVQAYLQGLEKDTDKDTGSDTGTRLLLHSYGNELRHADTQERTWRTRYYLVRSTVLIASAAITVISGISIPNGSVLALRIIVLALGALITVVTGFLDLFHMLNRWRIYRVMRYRLLAGSITAAGSTPAAALDTLAAHLTLATREFEDNYITQIATEGSPPKTPIDDPAGGPEQPQ